MNILLIYPQFPDTFWSFKYALSFIGKRSAFPPLGLITVAAMMPEEWPKRLVDLNIRRLRGKDLDWADMAFIGSMAVQVKSTKEVIKWCRDANLKTVCGGPLFTAEPDFFNEVDHLVLDEAELTLPSFLKDLKEGNLQRIYRASGYCDIQKSPPPLWELVDKKKYASMSVQFSRGCPHNCDFCNVTALLGHKPRLKTPNQILVELDNLYNAGWNSNIFFVDDNFIGNKKYLKQELLPALIDWRKGKKGCVFYTEVTINLADDPELLDLMSRAGFDTVFIGIESPDEASLAECHKTQNTCRDLVSNVKSIHQAGMQVMGGFIIGFDNDSPATFQRQIDLIQRSGIVTAMVGLLQAPPGTKLFERMKADNRVVGRFSGDNVDGTTNIIPQMGITHLMEGYRSIMRQIYSHNAYYERVKTFLRDFKTPDIAIPLDFQRFLAFFRSGFWLGLWSKERFQFWYLVFWTLGHKPRLVPLAITLAIYGYHYRRICKLYIY